MGDNLRIRRILVRCTGFLCIELDPDIFFVAIVLSIGIMGIGHGRSLSFLIYLDFDLALIIRVHLFIDEAQYQLIRKKGFKSAQRPREIYNIASSGHVSGQIPLFSTMPLGNRG